MILIIHALNKGYECAALMVEFSVYNIDYSESVTDSSTPLLDKFYYHKEKNFHLQFQESQNLIQNMTTHFLI